MDNDDIDITGLDEAAVVAALHNGTRCLGLGVLHDVGRIDAETVRKELEAAPKRDGVWRFDYYHGRPLKVSVGNGKVSGVRLYDRDAGDGACKRAIDALRG